MQQVARVKSGDATVLLMVSAKIHMLGEQHGIFQKRAKTLCKM